MRYAWRTDRQMDRMTDNTTTVCRRSAPRHNNNKGIFSWDFPEFEFSAPPGRLYTISIKTPFSDFHHKWVQGVRSDLNITLAQSNLANVTTNLRPVRTSTSMWIRCASIWFVRVRTTSRFYELDRNWIQCAFAPIHIRMCIPVDWNRFGSGRGLLLKWRLGGQPKIRRL